MNIPNQMCTPRDFQDQALVRWILSGIDHLEDHDDDFEEDRLFLALIVSGPRAIPLSV